MSQFSEMEWNAKWDWENFVAFGSKSIESPKKLQLAADWMIVDDGDIDAGSLNLSGGGGNSGSDGGHVSSSAKSSIQSASTDSSTNLRFSTIPGSSENSIKKTGTEFAGTSPPLEAVSVGSAEPLIGLKLGKRTYFENSGGGTVKGTSLLAMPTQSTTTTLKKTKSAGQNAPVCCQVEGCNIDLSMAKDYHRKHRVCDTHSKSPKVIVGGVERRFCQQCSRFHGLSEFDERKRSCRRRLSDHNARRRKPHQETIQFNPTRLSSPFPGGTQMSFLLHNSPHIQSTTSEHSTWDNASNSKFTLTKGYLLKSSGGGGTDEQLHTQGSIYMQSEGNGILASKNSTFEVLNPGSKGSVISTLDAAPDYGRALSLLSNNSNYAKWDSTLLLRQQNDDSTLTHPAIPEGVPLASTEFWLSSGHHQPCPTNHDIQRFRTPPNYDAADFYPNMFN